MTHEPRRLRDALCRWSDAERSGPRPPDTLEATLRGRFAALHDRRRVRRRGVAALAGVVAGAALAAALWLSRPGDGDADLAVTSPASPARETGQTTLLAPAAEPAAGARAFRPWGPAHRAQAFERARIVRMRVSAAALTSLGYDHAYAAAGGLVVADALVAEDGSVRALRPVSYEAGF